MRLILFLRCLFASPLRREAILLEDLNKYMSRRYAAKYRPIRVVSRPCACPRPHALVVRVRPGSPGRPVLPSPPQIAGPTGPGLGRANLDLFLTCPEPLFVPAKTDVFGCRKEGQ